MPWPTSSPRSRVSGWSRATKSFSHPGPGSITFITAATRAGSNLPFGVVGAAVLIMAGLILAVATTYLICGINIRAGGYASVIVALVLASLHSLILAAELVFAIPATVASSQEEGAGIGVFLPVVTSALITAAVVQLVYYLIRILMERRDA